jgi:RHS repeat-associated protein
VLVASVLPTLAGAQTEVIRAPEPTWTGWNLVFADYSTGQEYCDAYRSAASYGPLTFVLLQYPTETSIPEPVTGKCVTASGNSTVQTAWALHCPDGFTAQNTSAWSNGVAIPHFHFRGEKSYCIRSAGSIDKGKNLGQCRDGTCGVGNPISPSSNVGNKYQSETDYFSGGTATLRLQRSYNSGKLTTDEAAYRRAADNPWRFGRNWRSNYDLSLKLTSTQYVSSVTARRGDGRVIGFTLMSGVWKPDSDISDRLVALTNGSGNAAGWQYINAADDSVETYAVDGKLISIETRAGIAQALAYSDSTTPSSVAPRPGLLIRVTDSFGRQLNFTYDNANRVVTMTDPAGGVYAYAYGSSDNLISVTYPDTRVRTYVYNEQAYTSNTNLPNALTGIIDENNSRFSTYKYDSQGRAYSTEHANGVEKYTIAYSAFPTVTDAFGQARTHSFQTILGVPKYTSVSANCQGPGCGNVAQNVSYDVNGNVRSRQDFNNIWTTYVHDLNRNLETSRTEAWNRPQARTITTQWHPTYRLPTQIDEPGRRTTFTHDASGSVLTKTVVDTATGTARTWTYTFNSYGQVLTANGPRTDVSDVSTYVYYNCATGYECGQVQTIMNAAGHVTTYTSYNQHGQPLIITDPNGVMTTLTYDARQRLTSRMVGTEVTTVDYWPTGLLKKATLPDGSFVEYTYDAAHRLTDINDAEGNRIHYTLDLMGNRTSEQAYDPSNALTRTRFRVFNALNRLQKEIGAAGTVNGTTTFGYDNNGNQTSIAAPLGRNTGQGYDALNRLTSVTDPLNGVTQYGYNALDQLIAVTDPRSKVTSYTYNALGDLTQQVSPDTGTTINTYDAAGNLLTSTDARSKIATYAYDALNRVTSLTYSDQTIGYTYDSGTNQKGRLTEVTDGSGSTSWTYDAQGRVLSRQQSMGVTKSVGYAYDLNGRLQTLTLPSGNTIDYGYSDGKVTSLTLNGSTTILSNVLYQPFGPTRGWTWGNSSLAVREYDTDGLITDIDSAGLKSYDYDDAFRITDIADAGNAALSQSYGYDLLDRVTSATGTGLKQGWTYDANGNRLAQTGDEPSTYTVSSTSNRLTSISGAMTRSYVYNASGSITSDGTATFTYDDAGRLVSATKAGVTTTYSLNALGQRVRKTSGGTSTCFVYDEAGRLVGEYHDSGALIQETVWFGDIPVATIRPSGASVELFYVHADHLNTPRRISRPSDNVIVWRWDSDPFGATVANEDPDGDSSQFVNNLRFPGQYYDAEAGMHYNYFRDYDPSTGRYVQSDPIGLAGGNNTYRYVRANPLSRVDPNGLVDWVGASKGGSFFFVGSTYFELKTKGCWNGKRGSATVLFIGIGLSVGIDASFSASDVELKDSLLDVHPPIFEGDGVIGNVAFSVFEDTDPRKAFWRRQPIRDNVYGCSAVRLGNAGGVGCGTGKGVEFGVGGLYGRSILLNSSVEPCSTCE